MGFSKEGVHRLLDNINRVKFWSDEIDSSTIATFFLSKQAASLQAVSAYADCIREEVEVELPDLEWPTWRVSEDMMSFSLLRPDWWSYKNHRSYSSALEDLAIEQFWDVQYD